MAVVASAYSIVLGLHIAAVVIAFGVIFAYPLAYVIGRQLDPHWVPLFHRVQRAIGQRLISPALLVVVLAGVYLASDGHQWSSFFVQFGLASSLVLGALGGMFFAPTEARLAELAERDLSATGPGRPELGADYMNLRRTYERVGALAGLLVLLTVFLMTVKPFS